MLSLANAMSRDKVVEFEERIRRLVNLEGAIEYLAEYKLDGIAVELVYEKGRLAVGSTRGNELEGEDVTANLRTIRSVPLALRAERGAPEIPDRLEVRGEVIIPTAAFRRWNAERIERGLPGILEPAKRRRAGEPSASSTRASRPSARSSCSATGRASSAASRRRAHSEFLAACRAWGLRPKTGESPLSLAR